MVKIYHGSNIDAINWKIYVDNIDKCITHFPSGTKASDVADRLCQFNLLAPTIENQIYVVDIDGWKLADANVKSAIKAIHGVSDVVIFAYESATIKNKIFSELKIQAVKANAVTKRAKTSLIHKLLNDEKITLPLSVEATFVDILPDNIDFIKNEIKKLKLMGQSSFTAEEIKQIVFDLGDATVFNIIDSWLNDNKEQTVERLNDLMSKNITIQALVPILSLKLLQIKFFLTAKLAKWPSEIITAKQGIPFWQQSIYGNLRPYDKKLIMINSMLDKLYEFDINVKKQRNIPYTQLIKILFK